MPPQAPNVGTGQRRTTPPQTWTNPSTMVEHTDKIARLVAQSEYIGTLSLRFRNTEPLEGKLVKNPTLAQDITCRGTKRRTYLKLTLEWMRP